MVYEYDMSNNTLYLDSVELPPHNQEENVIGTCNNCRSVVQSVSYHSRNDKNIVAAKCTNCSTFHAIIYDDQWTWLGEEHVSINQKSDPDAANIDLQEKSTENHIDTEELQYLRSISLKKLNAVFSPAEIEAMFSKASGKKYVRQYLYRARKKYSDFRELFDIVINV